MAFAPRGAEEFLVRQMASTNRGAGRTTMETASDFHFLWRTRGTMTSRVGVHEPWRTGGNSDIAVSVRKETTTHVYRVLFDPRQ